MNGKRFQKNRSNSGFQKRATNYNDIQQENSTRPTNRDNTIGNNSETFAKKALSKLPFSQSAITVLADPYAQVLPKSDPYALLKADNPKYGGIYRGVQNLQGAGVKQYLTSQLSRFLDRFDFFHMSARCNYNYLPIRGADVKRGFRMVQTMINAMSEAMSQVTSTVVMLQPAIQYCVKTSMPMPNDAGTALESNYDKLHTDSAEVFYAIGIFYQSILQAVAQAQNRYNVFRANQGAMIRRSWEREVPRLNQLFGLMNKKALQTNVLSLGYAIEGEFFDKEFMQQISTMTAITGAKSDAMTDALLEFDSMPNIPEKFTVYASSSVIDGTVKPGAVIFDWSSGSGLGKEFIDAIFTLRDKWSVCDTINWARTYSDAEETFQDRYNAVVEAVSTISNFMTTFKIGMSDFRAILDVMSRGGFNNWTKIFRPGITRDTDVKTPYNLTVFDIFKLQLAGCTTLKYNAETKRWNGLALWNKYTGIPEYENWNGGSVLAFCTKQYEGGDETALGFLPILLDSFEESNTYMVNRLGKKVLVTAANYESTNVSANTAFSRLQPLPSVQRAMKTPVIYKTSWESGDDLTGVERSQAVATLVDIFDLCTVRTGSTSYEYFIDPDLLCFIDYEIEDYSNQVLAYCRSHGPFRVNTATSSGLGFGSD